MRVECWECVEYTPWVGVGVRGETQVGAHQLGEHLGHQRRLARAGHARHRGQHTERDVDRDVVEVVPRLGLVLLVNADGLQLDLDLGLALREHRRERLGRRR